MVRPCGTCGSVHTDVSRGGAGQALTAVQTAVGAENGKDRGGQHDEFATTDDPWRASHACRLRRAGAAYPAIHRAGSDATDPVQGGPGDAPAAPPAGFAVI